MDRRFTQRTHKTGLNVFDALHHIQSAIILLESMENTLTDLTTMPPSLGWDPKTAKQLETLGAMATRTLETLQRTLPRTL